MATIQTTIRVITVKESVKEVLAEMEDKMVSLTEDVSLYRPVGNNVKKERAIRLNRDYIIEVYD